MLYGPYTRKQDGRKIVIVDGITMSFARYLLEQKLGRKLLPDEEADHIDNDKTNDNIDNLQVLTKTANRTKQAENSTRKIFYFVCPSCFEDSWVWYNQYKNNQLKQGKAGPYCSRQCARKYQNMPH